MCTPSSLPPALAVDLRAIADRLVSIAATGPTVPSLGPALAAARLATEQARRAMALSPIGEMPFDEERRLRDALQSAGVALITTLARLDRS